MTGFSKKIKELIQESGFSVYQISKESGLGRTSIHRMMTGSLLPGRDFLNKFYDYMRFLPNDLEELEKLYMIEKIGIEKYEHRVFVSEMVKEISDYFNEKELNIYKDTKIPWDETFVTSSDRTQTLKMVAMVIDYEIDHYENPLIRFNISTLCKSIYRLILEKSMDSNVQINLHHQIALNQNPDRINNHNYNLFFLKLSMYYALGVGHNYSAKYCYSRLEEDDGFAFLWPYYLITHDHVMMISNDGHSAYIQTNKEIVCEYIKRFDEMFDHCKNIFGYKIGLEGREFLSNRNEDRNSVILFFADGNKIAFAQEERLEEEIWVEEYSMKEALKDWLINR